MRLRPFTQSAKAWRTKAARLPRGGNGIWVLERPRQSRTDALLLALLRLSTPASCPFCNESHQPSGAPLCRPYQELSSRLAEEWAARNI